MTEAFSGLIAGYAMALVFTALVARLIVGARSQVPFLSKVIAPKTSAATLTVPVSILAFLIWTIIGFLLGILYQAVAHGFQSEGIGSPHWPFTVGILIAGLLILSVIFYVWQTLRWEVLALVLSFVAFFGWALPHMANA